MLFNHQVCLYPRQFFIPFKLYVDISLYRHHSHLSLKKKNTSILLNSVVTDFSLSQFLTILYEFCHYSLFFLYWYSIILSSLYFSILGQIKFIPPTFKHFHLFIFYWDFNRKERCVVMGRLLLKCLELLWGLGKKGLYQLLDKYSLWIVVLFISFRQSEKSKNKNTELLSY